MSLILGGEVFSFDLMKFFIVFDIRLFLVDFILISVNIMLIWLRFVDSVLVGLKVFCFYFFLSILNITEYFKNFFEIVNI